MIVFFLLITFPYVIFNVMFGMKTIKRCVALVSSSLLLRCSMFVSVTDAFKAEISHGPEIYPTRSAATVGSDRK